MSKHGLAEFLVPLRLTPALRIAFSTTLLLYACSSASENGIPPAQNATPGQVGETAGFPSFSNQDGQAPPGTEGSGSSAAPPARAPTAGDDDDPSPSTQDGQPATDAPGQDATVEPGTSAARVDNPFADATGYVNPEWRANVLSEPVGQAIAETPTAVWLDRIAAIKGTTESESNGPMGLRDHLDAALEQGADYIQLVIYNLPGRDCAALASNGELGPDELPRYRSEYIDPIVAIMSNPAYATLRIINVIEVDSLPNLVTNLSVPACTTMKQNGAYVDGIAYALKQLGDLPNTYNYVDAGHHGWLGWETNLKPSAALFAEMATQAGFDNVHGFITNVSNYSALKEPFFESQTVVGGNPVSMSSWIDWNPYVDELSFALAFRQELISAGFDPQIGMLIDTSRNGWGGPDRPNTASSATDLNAFVDESRIDRRIHAGNWCNQTGAGLGERPTPAPQPGIDAYVWIKPPGESDGSSAEIANSDGKGFDRMCDPTYGGNALNGQNATGALPNAPISGAWFSEQFQELVRNAYPPL